MNTEKTALGIDIGGTKIYAGLVNKNGEILTPPAKYATPHSVDEIKKTLSDVIKNHGKTASIVAIATAGAVNKFA